MEADYRDDEVGRRRVEDAVAGGREAGAALLAEQLWQRPGASIPRACGDWGQTQAAYRFLANEDTSGEAVLQAHAQASALRMAAHPVVLCLQDTGAWYVFSPPVLTARMPAHPVDSDVA